MSIYDEMRSVANEIIGEFKQGALAYVSVQSAAGATPDDPQAPVYTPTAFNGTVRPVSTKYVDGSHIIRSDKQVTMPNNGVLAPTMDGFIDIDGERHKIVEIMSRPAAGPAIVWILIVRR